MKQHSIFRQWLASTLLTLFVLWIAVVASVTWVIQHETDEIFDASLQETAQRLLPLAILQLQAHQTSDDEEDDAFETIEDALEPAQHKEYLVYQVFNASGRMLMRSHSAPTQALTPQLEPGFQKTEGHWIYIEKSRNGQYLLALAEKTKHRRDTLLSTLEVLLMPLLALLPLSAMAMFWIARQAKQPLQKLDAELARRTSADLHPVASADFPQELQPLAQTLNQLMQRLKAALESERQFTANSAHELRTPLAAAAVQLDVLGQSLVNDEQRQRLQTVRQLLQRLQTLSEKLLQLARAESGIAFKRSDVELGQLLRLVCQDLQWRTPLPLQLQLPSSPVVVQGDVDALGIVLGNLLENAIKYATPGSAIQIEVNASPVHVRITNDCDPLSEEVRGRLHERFYRARPDHRGAGLGLSIVRALLEPTGIELDIHSPASGNSRGFEVVLQWPRATQQFE
jgi:two-component system OmpR family sensor kinase